MPFYRHQTHPIVPYEVLISVEQLHHTWSPRELSLHPGSHVYLGRWSWCRNRLTPGRMLVLLGLPRLPKSACYPKRGGIRARETSSGRRCASRGLKTTDPTELMCPVEPQTIFLFSVTNTQRARAAMNLSNYNHHTILVPVPIKDMRVSFSTLLSAPSPSAQ